MDKQVDYSGTANVFTGYDELAHASKVVALYHEGTATDTLHEGQHGIVVLDTTPFMPRAAARWGTPGVLAAEGMGFACRTRKKSRPTCLGTMAR